jgi:hypothetical protein
MLSLALILLFSALPVSARGKKSRQYGEGFIVNVPFPAAEVSQAVQEVVQNGIIRGSKEYNKDPYISGAIPATSTHAFPEWTEGGEVFYKVRLKALDPRNFKDSSDVGTLTVRYIVQPQGDKNSVLRIDAVFVEDFRRVSHSSDGSVESAEFKDIRDHLDAMDAMKVQTAEALKEKEQHAQHNAQLASAADVSPATPPPAVVDVPAADNPVTNSDASTSSLPQTPEERVRDLKRQVERLVKSPGAPLKSAPFHTATTLQVLTAGTEVLIVITTPYWFGVETHEGQHGWILRDELELVP